MEELAGDKARLLLREVEQVSSEDIRGFVACLRESGHAPLASLVTDTVDKITKKAKTPSSSTRRGQGLVRCLKCKKSKLHTYTGTHISSCIVSILAQKRLK